MSGVYSNIIIEDTGENGLLVKLINGTTLTEDFVDTQITYIRQYFLASISNPTINATFENVTAIANRVFNRAVFNALIMPNLTQAGTGAFGYFTGKLLLPNLTVVNEMAFEGCKTERLFLPKLASPSYQTFDGAKCISIDLRDIGNLGLNALRNTTLLKALILRKNDVVTIRDVNVLGGSMIASGTGYVYVPVDQVSNYQGYTNWVTYASQIRPFIEVSTAADIQTKLDDTNVAVNTLIICDAVDYDDGKYTLKTAAGEGEII